MSTALVTGRLVVGWLLVEAQLRGANQRPAVPTGGQPTLTNTRLTQLTAHFRVHTVTPYFKGAESIYGLGLARFLPLGLVPGRTLVDMNQNLVKI